jgi:ubiquinone/menaquinone biosynthesis C-methylase UbiE
MKEMIRVLKPDGIIVSIETSATWPVLPNTNEVNQVLPIGEARIRAPGHVLFVEKMGE